MRVFVTGASGFIGLHLLRQLVESQYRITALISPRGTPPSAWRMNGIDWVTGDARDLETLLAAIQGHDAVFHLAGRYPLLGKQPDPLGYVDSNTATTGALLEACRRSKIPRFVFASTATVYGKPDRVPIAESDSLNGATVYAASKIAAESLVRGYAMEFGIDAVSLRVFNTYGPGQPSANVVGTIIQQAIRPGPVSIYSGTPERDFVYVGDVARALIAGMRREGLRGQTINVASGTGIRIGSLARRIMEICGRSDAVSTRVPQHVGTAADPDSVIGDINLAYRLLDWRPAISLDEGLLQTIAWTRTTGLSAGLP